MIGLEHGRVDLLPHTPEWNYEATRTINALQSILGKIIKEAEHVGSTAINNIKAKPIIDIAVAATNFSDIMTCNDKLLSNGFYYRYALDNTHNIIMEEIDFAATDVRQLLYTCGGFYNGSNLLQTHFIHVVKVESNEWHDYINFRDYLITHPIVAKEYEKLKIVLSKKYADNRKEYTTQKNDFIRRILNLF